MKGPRVSITAQREYVTCVSCDYLRMEVECGNPPQYLAICEEPTRVGFHDQLIGFSDKPETPDWCPLRKNK